MITRTRDPLIVELRHAQKIVRRCLREAKRGKRRSERPDGFIGYGLGQVIACARRASATLEVRHDG